MRNETPNESDFDKIKKASRKAVISVTPKPT